MIYPIYPESSVAITTYFKDPDYYKQFKSQHYGIDLAYQNKYHTGAKNIYAVAEGEVTECVNPSDTTTLKWLNIRSVINGQHVIHRYFHFSKIFVKKGDKVKQGDVIGLEGKTGVSTGSHLELQYWLVPADYVYKAGDTKKYAVNPCDHIFLGAGQTCVHDPKGEVKKMPEIIEVPLPAGSTFSCVKDNALWYRTTPERKGDNKKGLLPIGVYEAVATCENDGYTWCHFKLDAVDYYAAVYEDISFITLPTDWEKLYEEEKAKNAELEQELVKVKAENAELRLDLGVANEKLDEVKAAIKILQKYGG